jgi:hypothetical protein
LCSSEPSDSEPCSSGASPPSSTFRLALTLLAIRSYLSDPPPPSYFAN